MLAIARPEIVGARRGIGFDTGWGRADKWQQQCAGRQQVIGCDCAWRHWAVDGSHHSARVCKLPVSEITSSVVNNLKTVRIGTETLCLRQRLVKERPVQARYGKGLLRRGKELHNSVSHIILSRERRGCGGENSNHEHQT
jgi:hypothetical protein